MGVIALSAVLSATLSGCLRQAAEPFEPASAEILTLTVAPPDPAGPTNTLPPIFTISAPTLDGAVGDDPANTEAPLVVTPEGPVGTQPLIVTIAFTATDPAPTPDADADSSTTTEPGGTFITPGSPLNPTIVETPMPTLTPTSDAPTRSAPGGAGDSGDDDESAVVDVPDDCVHVVVSGDTLFNIALAYDTNLAAVRAANPEIVGDLIQPGQEIRLPNCEGGQLVLPPTTTPASTLAAPPGGQVHTVSAGETLSTIAARYGVTVAAIVEANNLTNPDRISLGQQLIIP